MMKGNLKDRAIAFLGLALVGPLLASCGPENTIKVGFSGPLTGRNSDLGVHARNGAQMAIRDFNTAGGLDGQLAELIVLDDRGTIDGAIVAADTLVAQDVMGIIGPMTSSQAVAIQGSITNWRGAVVAPTVTTPALDQRIDSFFRVIPSHVDQASLLATFALDADETKSVVAIGDSYNAEYVDSYIEAFLNRFEAGGGEVRQRLRIESNIKKNWTEIVSVIADTVPDGVLFVASARDTALLAQALAAKGIHIPVYGSTWASSREVILAGGKSVEGFVFSAAYSVSIDYPRHAEFNLAYTNRYGYRPNFSAAFAYEATSALMAAIVNCDGRREELHRALISLAQIDGVLGKFRFTETGDVKRDSYLIQVRDGELSAVDTSALVP